MQLMLATCQDRRTAARSTSPETFHRDSLRAVVSHAQACAVAGPKALPRGYNCLSCAGALASILDRFYVSSTVCIFSHVIAFLLCEMRPVSGAT